MNMEIKCPNCGKVFAVDESGYAQIAQQVRDQEFNRELQHREQELTKHREMETKLAVSEAVSQKEKEREAALEKKNKELAAKEKEKKTMPRHPDKIRCTYDAENKMKNNNEKSK